MESENMGYTASGLLENIKALNFSGIVQSIKQAPIDWNMSGIFFGIGFLCSFLFKRYYKMFLICSIVGGLLVWGLDHFFHIIDWTAFHMLMNDVKEIKLDLLFEFIANWIAHNLITSLAAVLGFVLGLLV